MAKAGMPSNSGAEFYGPGAIEAEYSKIMRSPELPSVAPPSAAATSGNSAMAAVYVRADDVDPSAPDVLALIQGGRFKTPFTVTLMRRDGVQVFKTDAGSKTEASYKLCKETIREPADLLRIRAAIHAEVYKPLNDMTLEFQFMLYLAHVHGALNSPKAAAAPKASAEEESASQD